MRASLVVALACAGCFYSEPINREPIAALEQVSSGPIWRGSRVVFSGAASRDPDGDSLTREFRAFQCDARGRCETVPFAEQSAEEAAQFVFVVPPTRADGEPSGTIEVQLEVTDAHRATATIQQRISIQNRPPSVMLSASGFSPLRLGEYPVGTRVEVAATATDPDPSDAALVRIDWSRPPLLPPGVDASAIKWEPSDSHPDVAYLTATAAGQYTVRATAVDVVGATSEDDLSILFVADAPACVATTTPPSTMGTYVISRADGPRWFAIASVRDDLDPYPQPTDATAPPSLLRFEWSLASPATSGELLELTGYQQAGLRIDPTDYAPGSRLAIRVQALDRVSRELPCDPWSMTCSIGGNDCLQRVGWDVEIR